jgi:hypothetical protein
MNGISLPISSAGESVAWKIPEFTLPEFEPDESVANPWHVIHTRYANAMHSDQWHEATERTWLNTEFPKLIPSSCGCGGAWQPLSDQLDLSTAEAAFRSVWAAHNTVSTQHCQPPLPAMPYDQCRSLWLGPKVLFLSTAYQNIGGTETFHRTLLPRLRHCKNIIGFVATGAYNGDGSLLKVPYFTGVEAARRLATEADVIVTWGIDSLANILPSDRPKVISVHHSDWSSDWSNNLQLNQLDLIDAIVCVNADVAKRLQSIGKHVCYIANAVDPERLKPSQDAAKLREQYNIQSDAKIVLFAHRLSPEKQPLKALEISKHLPADWIMVMAGDGVLMEDCKRLAGDKVRIVGAVDSIADWLSVSQRFLSLSNMDGYGLSVAESLAAGVPVVSTPVGVAVGNCLTLPSAASNQEWAKAIESEQRKPVFDCGVDRFVNQWNDLLSLVTKK